MAEPVEGEEWEEEDEILTPTTLSDQDSLDAHTAPNLLGNIDEEGASHHDLQDVALAGGGVAKVKSIHSAHQMHDRKSAHQMHDRGSAQGDDHGSKPSSQPDKPVSPNKSGQHSANEKPRCSRAFAASSYCCKDSPISRMVTASRRTTSILKARLLSGSVTSFCCPFNLQPTCLQE